MATINKIILSLLVFSNLCLSLELEVFSTKTYGTVLLEISAMSDKSANVKSNSNVFSVNGEKSFGSYIIKSDLSSVLKSLKNIETSMNKLEQTLSLSKSSLSKLYKGKEHDYYIKINGSLVANSSPFYTKIKSQIDKILSIKKIEVIKEYKLVDSDLTVTTKNKTSTTVFDKEKNCSGSASSGVCRILDIGFISL